MRPMTRQTTIIPLTLQNILYTDISNMTFARHHRRAVSLQHNARLATLHFNLLADEICVEKGRDAGDRTASGGPGLMSIGTLLTRASRGFC